MGFLSKANGLFFYVIGLTILFVAYAFLEPTAKSSAHAGAKLLTSLMLLIKLFYAMAIIFILLGIFIFGISSFYAVKKRHYY